MITIIIIIRAPYTERKDVERRICGRIWESNWGRYAQKAANELTALILLSKG